MPAPFLLTVHSDDAELGAALASALKAQLGAAGARVTIQNGPRGLPGVSIRVGVWDAEGAPRWLSPLPVEETAEAAARKVVSFLESWGFIVRRTLAVPPRAA